ncbi:MAG: aminopeptidase, partial [Pseudomonadota bacterium]
ECDVQNLTLSSLRLILLCAALGGLTGCSTLGFYSQAVSGHMALMRARVPVAESLADPDLDPEIRQKLEIARDARRFALDTLGLPDNGSYTAWVDLGRPAVTWNVVATERFSVDPLRWCFPIAGCLSYRGYFDRADAVDYADRLAEQGYDTTVSGATAYSSLGWFKDPLVTTMFRGDDASLASVLFHELAHQQLYVGDDSSFNESFATFVEMVGVDLWLEATDRRELLEPWLDRRARRDDFIALLSDARVGLQAGYARGGTESELTAFKEAAFAELKRDYQALRTQWGGYTGYDWWFDKTLNNAHLAGVATYTQWVGAFAALFERVDRDFGAFFAAAAELAELPIDERRTRLVALSTE